MYTTVTCQGVQLHVVSLNRLFYRPIISEPLSNQPHYLKDIAPLGLELITHFSKRRRAVAAVSVSIQPWPTPSTLKQFFSWHRFSKVRKTEYYGITHQQLQQVLLGQLRLPFVFSGSYAFCGRVIRSVPNTPVLNFSADGVPSYRPRVDAQCYHAFTPSMLLIQQGMAVSYGMDVNLQRCAVFGFTARNYELIVFDGELSRCELQAFLLDRKHQLSVVVNDRSAALTLHHQIMNQPDDQISRLACLWPPNSRTAAALLGFPIPRPSVMHLGFALC